MPKPGPVNPQTKPERISRREAVRIALAAQGFAGARRTGKRGAAHLNRVLDRTGMLQIDSVNVLMRAHYLPAYSRLGAYDPALLDEAAWGGRRALFEYWAHEASLLPLALQPDLRWRMARAERLEGLYGGYVRFAREKTAFVEDVLREVENRGHVTAADLDRANHKGGGWWAWTDTKIALEFLFRAGRVATATRRGFERVYDLPERVYPPAILAKPTPDEADAQRRLISLSARALGVATESDLRDYFRLDLRDARARIGELVEDKRLVAVSVEGWRQPAFLDPEAAMPGAVTAHALLSPFDPLVWERDRAERLFDFRYRLEIYTPAHKREHGYYVLPFLMGERIAARVDLKADRPARVLRVLAAHLEPGAKAAKVADALSEELRLMAGWLGLERIVVEPKGDLAAKLTESCRVG